MKSTGEIQGLSKLDRIEIVIVYDDEPAIIVRQMQFTPINTVKRIVANKISNAFNELTFNR